MPFVPAPGVPNYSVGGAAYIPYIFARKTVVKYYDATVLAAISNTDYEGVSY